MSRLFVIPFLIILLSFQAHIAQAGLSNSIMPGSILTLVKSNYIYWVGFFFLGFWCQLNSNKGRFISFASAAIAFFIACFLYFNKINLPFPSYIHLIPFFLLGALILFSVAVSGIIEALVAILITIILAYSKISNGLNFEQFWTFSLMKVSGIFMLFYAGAGFSQMIKSSYSDNNIKFLGLILILIGLLPIFL